MRPPASDWIAICVQKSLLVFAVIFLIGYEALAAGVPRLPDVAKSSSPPSVVDIFVIDAAKYVQMECPALCRYNGPGIVDRRSRQLFFIAFQHVPSQRWADRCCGYNINVGLKKEIVRQSARIASPRQMRKCGYLICRRLAVIPKCYSDKVTVNKARLDPCSSTIPSTLITGIICAGGFDGKPRYSDVSSKLPAFGSFHCFNRPLHVPRLDSRIFPETVSSTPESIGECAQCHSSERDNGSIIFVGEIPHTNIVQAEPDTKSYDRAADNATTFMKGLILLGVLSALYAVGKRFGLLDDKRNPQNGNDSNQNPKGPLQ